QVAGLWDGGTANREARGAHAPDDKRDGPRVVAAHRAVRGDAGETARVIARCESCEGDEPVRAPGLAHRAVYGDGVAVGVDVGTGSANRDGKCAQVRQR